MEVTDKFGIIVIVFLALVQLTNRKFLEKYVKLSFILAAVAMFASASYVSFLQYNAWKADPRSVFLLPPHTSWTYFTSYVVFRFFSPFLISLAAALVFKGVAETMNKRSNERFFEKEESWLFAAGVLLSGYPGFIFYFPMMMIAAFFVSAAYSILGKGRGPLFYVWLPVAIFAILFKSQIPQSLLNNFII